jgi:hypothetical protein
MMPDEKVIAEMGKFNEELVNGAHDRRLRAEIELPRKS